MTDLNKILKDSGYLDIDKPEDNRSEFRKGATSAIMNTVAGGKALVGAITSNPGMQYGAINDMARYGRENQGSTPTLEDIDGFGEFTDWLSYNLGSGTASIGTMIAGGGLPGMAVKGIAKGALVGSARAIGAGAAGFTPNYGESLNNVYQETGEIKNMAAFTAAGIKTGLDVFTPLRVLRKSGGAKVADRITDRIKMKLVNDNRFKSAMMDIAKTSGIEAVTEGAQSYVDQVAANILTEEGGMFGVRSWSELINSAAAGAAGSAGFGAYGGYQTAQQATGLRQQSEQVNNNIPDDMFTGMSVEQSINSGQDVDLTQAPAPQQQQTNYETPAVMRQAGINDGTPSALFGFGNDFMDNAAMRQGNRGAQNNPMVPVDQAQTWQPGFTMQDPQTGMTVPQTGMSDYTYEGELIPGRNAPRPSVPVGQVLNAPIVEGEFQNVPQADLSRPAITDKNIVFGGSQEEQAQDNVIYGRSPVNVQKDGNPFRGKKAVALSVGFKAAKKEGLNPQVVTVKGGYGWQPSQTTTQDQPTLSNQQVQTQKQPVKTSTSPVRQQNNTVDPLNKPVEPAPIGELSLSKDIPQFKTGSNEEGVVEPLTGEYDPVGMAPIQVWVRNNGDKEIITGRHRFDLAKRAGAKTIPAQYHYEEDGFTAEDGKRTDAILNIRDDKGQVEDYVELFQQDQLTEEDANELGLLDRAIGRTAYKIASSATSETVEAQRSGRITGQAAERLAEAAPKDEALQALGIKALVNDQRSISFAENLIRAVSSMRKNNGPNQETGDMFGFDDSAMREAEEMAKAAASKQRELRTRLTAIRGAAKNPKVAKAEGIDIRDPESLNKRIDELSAKVKAWDNWHTTPELVNELRSDIGAQPMPEIQTSEIEQVVEPEVNPDQDSFFGDPETNQQAFEREQETQAKIKAEENKTKQQEAKVKADNDLGDFTLTGSNRISDVGAAAGQSDLFGAKQQEPQASERGNTQTANTLSGLDKLSNKVSDKQAEALAELSALLKKKKGTLNSGIDPEIVLAVAKLGGYTLANGTIKFAQWARDVLNLTRSANIPDNDVLPYLKEAYGSIAYNPEKYDVKDEQADQMDAGRVVSKINLEELTKQDQQTTDGEVENNASVTISRVGKAWLVSGDTKPIKDNLKAAGGSWNRKYQGWIFPNSKYESARKAAGDNVTVLADKDEQTASNDTRNKNETTNEPDEASNQGSAGIQGNGKQGVGSRGSSNGANGNPGGQGNAEDVRNGSGASTVRGGKSNNTSSPFQLDSIEGVADGTKKQRVDANLAAIRLSKEIQKSNRTATQEEKAILAKYVGWGGLKSVFDNVGTRSNFEKEADQELKSLLSESEYNSVRNSIRTAFYTSKEVVKGMWDGISRLNMMVEGTVSNVIEPSVGTGNFIGWMPKFKGDVNWYATELDPITGTIAQQIYDNADIRVSGFQDAPFKTGIADLVIGNPPFGSQPLYDKRFKDISGLSLHNFMVAKSAKLLRENGLMAMVITNRFLDTKNQNHTELSKLVDFVGAVRLPNTAFKSNAGTEVTTDIVVFRKLKNGETAKNTSWTDTNGNISGIKINKYFEQNPGNILGRLANDGTMYGGRDKGELTVYPTSEHSDLQKSISNKLANIFANVDFTKPVSTSNNTDIMMEESDLEIGGMMINESGSVLYRDEDSDSGATIINVTPATILDPKGKVLTDLQELLNQNDGQTLAKYVRDNMLNTKGNPSGEYSAKAFKTLFDYLGYSTGQAKLKAPLSAVKSQINDAIELKRLGPVKFGKIRDMLNIRNTALSLIKAEKTDANNIEALRKQLNEQYDSFAKAYEVKGILATITKNQNLLMDSVSIESALDDIDDNARITKHAIFESRVIEPYVEPTKASNLDDAVTYSIQNTGTANVDAVASLLGISTSEARKKLTEGEKPYLLMDPESGELTFIDDYLSGNVKKKYEQAIENGLDNNAKLLKPVLPKDKPASKVKPSIRATWMDASVFESFLSVMGYESKVSVSPAVGKISIQDIRSVENTELAQQFRHERATMEKLFEHAANGKSMTIYDRVGESSVKNEQATKTVNVLINKLAEAFESWANSNQDIKQQITSNFNDRVNTHVERKYNGRLYLRPVGVNPKVKLRKTQLDGALRVIQSQNSLLDHVVGAGKTFTEITAIMERRRLGLSKKPLLAVPNHIIGSFASDFYTLYPGANILVVSEKQMSKKNRKRFFSKIATGDYDAIIIGHSHLKNLPNSPQAEEFVINEKLKELREAKEDAKREAKASGGRGASVAQIEEAIDRLNSKLKEMQEKAKEKDDDIGLNFEEMGIDFLAIDEAHIFKNLMYSTSSDRVKGMNDPKGSNHAFDLLIKARTIQALGKRGGVSFMTGTPISNSLVEIYTMMYYLGYQDLKDNNISNFDSFAGSFLNTETALEYTPTGTLTESKVLKGVNNTKELAVKYRQFADVITRDDLVRIYADDVAEQNEISGENNPTRFPTPRVKGGKRQIDLAPATGQQILYNDSLIARMEAINSIRGRQERMEYAKIDNPLWVMSDAKKASLDIRMVDPTARRDPTGKVARAAKNIKTLYDQWNKDKGTQLVFSDMGVPAKFAISNAKARLRELASMVMDNGKVYVDSRLASLDQSGDAYSTIAQEISDKAELMASKEQGMDSESYEAFSSTMQKSEGLFLTADTGFSMYDDLRSMLVEQGIPQSEIAFIHDHDTQVKKKTLFDKVNSGKIRILIGSSAKMGAGTNVQERLVGLHHLDAPWRPSEMEQREGRIIRQGNKLFERDPDNFEVDIKAYATSGSSDPVMWQILERKASGIEQFRQGEIDEFVEEGETDSASFAELKAQTTGNPVYRKKIQSDSRLLNIETTFRAALISQSSANNFLAKYEDEVKRVGSALTEIDSFDIEQYNAAEFTEKRRNSLEAFEVSIEQFDRELELHNTLSPEEKKTVKKPKAPKRPSPLDINNKFMDKLKVDIIGPVDDYIENQNGDKSFSMPMGKSVQLIVDVEAKNGEGLIDVSIKVGQYKFLYSEGRGAVKTLSGSHSKIASLMPNQIEAYIAKQKTNLSGRLEKLKKDKVTADNVVKNAPDRTQFDKAQKENDWLTVSAMIADTIEDIRRSKTSNKYIDNASRPISRSRFNVGSIASELYEYNGEEYQSVGLKLKLQSQANMSANIAIPAFNVNTGKSVHLYAKAEKGEVAIDILEVSQLPEGVEQVDYSELRDTLEIERTSQDNSEQSSIVFNRSRESAQNGVTLDEAKAETKRFTDYFKGVDDAGFDSIITDKKPSEIFGPSIAADDNYIKGAFDKNTNRLFIFSQNHSSKGDIRRTLREELLVHKGLGLLQPQEVDTLLSAINETRNSSNKQIQKIWQHIDKNYADTDAIIQAEEFLGKVAQDKPSLTGKYWSGLVAALVKIMRKVGLVNPGITLSEMRNEVYKIGELLRRPPTGKPPGGKKSNDVRMNKSMDKFDELLQRGLDDPREIAFQQEYIAAQRKIGNMSADKEQRLDQLESDLSLAYQYFIKPNRALNEIGKFKDPSKGKFALDEVLKYDGIIRSNDEYLTVSLPIVKDTIRLNTQANEDGMYEAESLSTNGQWKYDSDYSSIAEFAESIDEQIDYGRMETGLDSLENGLNAKYYPASNNDIRFNRVISSAKEKLGLGDEEPVGIVDSVKAALGGATIDNIKQGWSNWRDRATEGIFDSLYGIKKAEESVGIDQENQGYVSARLASGVADVVHAVMFYGAPKWQDGIVQRKENTKGMLEVFGMLNEQQLNNWLAWMAGNRANGLMEQGRENNLTQAEIDELLKLNEGNEELFNRVKGEYNKINAATLDLAEGAGLVSSEVRQGFDDEYYVPFFRDVDTEDNDVVNAIFSPKGIAGQSANLKRLKGGKMRTKDILENILLRQSKMIEASMKNKAMLEVANNLDGTGLMEEVKLNAIEIQQVYKNKGKTPYVSVLDNGEKTWYQVNEPSLLRGLTQLNLVRDDNPWIRLGRAAKRFLTVGVTMSPEFIFRNFIRDSAHGWMINKDKFKFGIDSVKGAAKTWSGDQDTMDMMFAGASFQGGYVHATDPEASAQLIRRALRKKGLNPSQINDYLASIPQNLGEMVEKYREFSDGMENANRASTYTASRAAGKSKKVSAFESKDFMDFSLQGNYRAMQTLVDLIPFLNARLQGMYKLKRASIDQGENLFIKRFSKELATKGMMVAGFSLALAALNSDDERYEELQDWDKDANWHFFLGDNHIRIPKPFELGIIFGTMPERMFHLSTGDQKSKDLGKSAAHALLSTMAFNPIPQFVKPALEAYTNYDMFAGRDIDSFGDLRKRPEDRYSMYTTGTARNLGELLGMSPNRIDHVIRGYGGTLAAYVLAAADGIANTAATATGNDTFKYNEFDDLSLVRAFVKNGEVGSSYFRQEYYDMLKEVNALYGQYKEATQENDLAAAQEILKDNRIKLQFRPMFNKAQTQMNKLNQQSNLIWRNKDMPRVERERMLDELSMQKNALARRIILLYREYGD